MNSFDSLGKASITVLHTITNDNWSLLLIEATTFQEKWIGLVYCFTIVFLVNYLVFGLVTAVLLDAFTKELEIEDDYQQSSLKSGRLKLVGIQENPALDSKETFNSEIT